MNDSSLKQVTSEQALNNGEIEDTIRLDPHIQEVIGKALRSHYDDILKLPIPDTMLVLLAELEAKERNKG